jgi:LuxR family maltose regulon positive regulatory protein
LFSIQFFLIHKEYARGLAWTESLLERIEKRKTYYYMVRILAWQALMYFELNQETLAINSLERALLLAVPEGFVRSFMVGGAHMIEMLHRARAAGLQTAYLDKLLACMEPKRKHQPLQLTADSRLLEALSDREMEVLNLLARGFTDKKIAETLVIARETVHKHLKNIYEKLDVHSRAEAVALARELGLLEPR